QLQSSTNDIPPRGEVGTPSATVSNAKRLQDASAFCAALRATPPRVARLRFLEPSYECRGVRRILLRRPVGKLIGTIRTGLHLHHDRVRLNHEATVPGAGRNLNHRRRRREAMALAQHAALAEGEHLQDAPAERQHLPLL